MSGAGPIASALQGPVNVTNEMRYTTGSRINRISLSTDSGQRKNFSCQSTGIILGMIYL